MLDEQAVSDEQPAQGEEHRDAESAQRLSAETRAPKA